MLLRPFIFLAALAPLAVADVEFTTPAAGASVAGGTTISVAWKDSGSAPSVSDLTSYQLFLCAGGNDASNFIQLAPITTAGTFSTGNAASGTVQVTIGGSTTNAYFLKMISVATAGGTVTNYSPRFSLTGMTGTFPANVIAGIATVTGTDGPPTENQVTSGDNAANSGPAGPFTQAYNLQTGLTKYAPMQPIPPTSITAKSATPLYPTSAVIFAKTWLPRPSQVTTLTQSGTFSVSSMENTAAAAAQPSDDMQKFLNRWKD
ncbi:MAG: hypothetical protein M1827_002690 [Pycnora praestabilis]|nr:MAG: hypothetical protein M1827_002690 [Pycnora praestabilis]